jgi:hypothetical protein
MCGKSQFARIFWRIRPDEMAPHRHHNTCGDTFMKAKSLLAAITGRANVGLALTLLLALFAAGSALAGPGTPEQKKACTPDVYRLCAGEIPNVRAITSCLRRQKASLSEACRAVFEQ